MTHGYIHTRTVTGRLRNPEGISRPGVTIRFQLNRSTYTSLGLAIPDGDIAETTDEDGDFTAVLWCNADGTVPVQYICKTLDGKQFSFHLPYAVEPFILG